MGGYARLMEQLSAFVRDEQMAGQRQLDELWRRPIGEKLQTGWSQRFLRLERAEDPATLWAFPDAGESRFREGDLLLLHAGSPYDDLLGRGFCLEAEHDDRWLLRGRRIGELLKARASAPCYADPDAIDLTPLYERTLQELAGSDTGQRVILPLLGGDLAIGFDPVDVDRGEQAARDRGFNRRQQEAVGLALGAQQLACIQGPPGTGKSSVLALIAKLLVARGERVFVTSHTHMAINNALNKIHAEGVPAVKIGLPTQRKGLDDDVPCAATFAAWHDRPETGGWVIGATPFATCSPRLEACAFDTILFDEASQVTVPLALMAMRQGRRFVFVGDQQQLPPVMRSRSVLDGQGLSAFAVLTSRHADHGVMLDETYRMNRWLTAWPSQAYYGGALRAVGGNRDRCLGLDGVPELSGWSREVFDPTAWGVFIPTLDRTARAQNFRDAALVAELCRCAVQGGLPPEQIGIVTPYRAQGRALRALLRGALGAAAAAQVVADTVERMQGQERELVILSLATGDERFLGAVAEFFFQPQRLNVAITRARTKLIVVGPALAEVPDMEQEPLRRWIGQYVDLLRHLKRVTVPDEGR